MVVVVVARVVLVVKTVVFVVIQNGAGDDKSGAISDRSCTGGGDKFGTGSSKNSHKKHGNREVFFMVKVNVKVIDSGSNGDSDCGGDRDKVFIWSKLNYIDVSDAWAKLPLHQRTKSVTLKIHVSRTIITGARS